MATPTATRRTKEATATGQAPDASGQEPYDEGAGAKARALLAWALQTRIVRSVQRYGKARGGLLAGGIAYSALFSIVAALTLAWTVFMATLGGNPDMRSSVIRAVNQVLPGILQDGGGGGIIDPDRLVLDSAVNVASIVSTLVLVWTAISIMTNIRMAVQTMFGIVAPIESFVLQKLRDLGGFVAMALGIVTSAMLGTAASTMGRAIMQWVGLEDDPVASLLIRIVALAVAAAVAALTFAFLFRVTAAVRPLRRDLALGSVVGGVAVQFVLFLGTSLVSSVSDNPLLAASASIATLLLFVNLLSRVLLFVASFTANPPAPVKPKSAEEVHFNEQPNFVTLSAPATLAWEYQDVSGQIDIDVSLRPGTRPRAVKDDRPTQDDVRPDGTPIPYDGAGWWARRRLVRKARSYERRAVRTRARLGQRPRIQAAERKYWASRGGEETSASPDAQPPDTPGREASGAPDGSSAR
ncbi:MAG: YihY/virulence factor BrkB family protein [Dermatophilaceae bacterium]